MTTINLREPAEQALKAMRCAVPTGTITLYEWDKAISDLAAALAQQAEAVAAAAQYSDIVSDGGMDPRNKYDTAPPQQAEPVEQPRGCSNTFGCRCPKHFAAQQAEPTTGMAEITRLRAERDALAQRLREVCTLLADTIDRHRERLVMAAWESVRACPDCHGIGYDASGQLCGCQDNPSFG